MAISKEGASAFFWLSYISCTYGLIETGEFDHRMDWLSEMTNTSNNFQTQSSGLIQPDELPQEERSSQNVREVESSESGCFPRKRFGAPWLYFLAKGGLSNWYLRVIIRRGDSFLMLPLLS